MKPNNLEANYFKIGAFVLLGIAIIVVALLVFGSQKLFERTAYIETYFEESVQGISIGSPVKYRGLQIGYVKEIAFTGEIYHDPEKHPVKLHNRSIYVKIAITSKLFTNLSKQELINLLANEVASGLRVKLTMQGLTGTSYLELNYLDPKTNPVFKLHWQPENIYVPSATSTITQLSETIQNILNDVKDVNFKEVFNNVTTLTQSLDNLAHNADGFIGRIDAPMELTIQNLRTVSSNLRALTEHLKTYPSQIIFGGAPPILDPNKL